VRLLSIYLETIMGYIVVAVAAYALGYVSAKYGVDAVAYIRGLLTK